MNRTTNFRPHAVTRQDRADGSILLTSDLPLGPVARRTGDWLHRWASEAPDRVFLAERSGPGWREVSYVAALQQVRALAASLVGRGLGPGRPIMVLSANGVDHGLLALAAQYIGAPIVPVAEQYSLIPEAHGRLAEVATLIHPAMAYVSDADRFADALRMDALGMAEIVAGTPGGQAVTPFDELLKGDAGADVDAAFAAVGPDSVVKILMTSGSTSSPKGVETTQRMMCVNQAQLAVGLPFLAGRAHRIVDWLPWNHVFGGSHNFNMMLANGGSVYVDDGKPLKGPFERTVENLRMVCGTLVFNVPLGFALLMGVLRADKGLRQRFFEDLDMIFYAGASLPQETWEAFEAMAMEIKGEVPLMTSSWGLTETAPANLLQQEPTDRSGVVGVPVPGSTVKLVPTDERYEVRVKGDNVMPGYFNDPEKTAQAFDDEGYFITGDAMAFVDPADPNRGLRFDGRISEDFKLQSGIWVRAAALRAEALAALAPLAADLVVTGEGHDQIGLLIVPNRDALAEAGHADAADGGALTDAGLLAEIAERLKARAAAHEGSSIHIARALVMADPPSLPDGEMTAKGNLNIRRLLSRRADLLNKLYSDDPAVVRV